MINTALQALEGRITEEGMNDIQGQVIAKMLNVRARIDVLERVAQRVADSLEERVINKIQESVQNRAHEINTALQAFERSITHHMNTALVGIQHMNTELVGIEEGVREATANQRASAKRIDALEEVEERMIERMQSEFAKLRNCIIIIVIVFEVIYLLTNAYANANTNTFTTGYPNPPNHNVRLINYGSCNANESNQTTLINTKAIVPQLSKEKALGVSFFTPLVGFPHDKKHWQLRRNGLQQ